eukprot:3113613-Pleurochrysis_carterae.AAC.1
MPSCPILLCFACTFAVLAPALHVYMAHSRPLRFGVFLVPSAWPTLPSPASPERRPPQARSAPAPEYSPAHA